MSKASIASRSKGRKMAHVRVNLDLSQEDLARRADVSTKTIWSVEQGMTCRPFTKRKIMHALKLEWAERTKFFATTPRRRSR